VRPGPIRSAKLDRLASACHALSAGPCLSHRRAGAERWEGAEKKKPPGKNTLIPLSVPEIRHLLWRLVWQNTLEQAFALAWSVWRRKHQAKAQFYHYQRRNRSG
jgi:hypothetical protein